MREYLQDRDGPAAALRAGYSAKGLRRCVFRLLSHPAVIEALERAGRERAELPELNAEAVLREMARLAFCSLPDLVEWGDGGLELRPSGQLSRAQAAAIREVSRSRDGTLKIKLYDKPRLLSLLFQHLSGREPENGERERIIGGIMEALRAGPDPEQGLNPDDAGAAAGADLAATDFGQGG